MFHISFKDAICLKQY